MKGLLITILVFVIMCFDELHEIKNKMGGDK